MRLMWSMAWMATWLAAGVARAETPSVDAVEALVRGYVASFVSPATDLAYGIRIDGRRVSSAAGRDRRIADHRARTVAKVRCGGHSAGLDDPPASPLRLSDANLSRRGLPGGLALRTAGVRPAGADRCEGNATPGRLPADPLRLGLELCRGGGLVDPGPRALMPSPASEPPVP